MKRVLAIAIVAVALAGCAAFSKTATPQDAALAESQIRAVGDTISATLPPPWGWVAGAGTLAALAVAALVRGKAKAA